MGSVSFAQYYSITKPSVDCAYSLNIIQHTQCLRVKPSAKL
jgi:hypothetical protein